MELRNALTSGLSFKDVAVDVDDSEYVSETGLFSFDIVCDSSLGIMLVFGKVVIACDRRY